MATDYSYIGSGNILIREFGAAAPFLEVGNCSNLTFSPQEDVKELQDFTKPGGGLRNEVRRLTKVEIGFTFHDFSAENFTRGLRATSSTINAGTVTDEQVVAYKGGYAKLARIAATITQVRAAGGSTPLTVGTDYELRDGMIYLPAGSTVADPVSGAPNIEVDYTSILQKKVEALVSSNKQYEVVFMGLNEARSGKKVRVSAHKVSGGVIQQFALIGEDYGAGETSGALLADTTKATGLSQYFTVEFEE